MCFFQTCTKILGPPGLETLPAGVNPEAPLLRHAAHHSVPIDLPHGMDEQENEMALRYSTNAFSHKEVEFIHTELAEQVQARHMEVFPMTAVNALPNLWLYPITFNPQVGQQPRLIFDFTWSGMNNATKRLVPMKAICFGGELQHIIRQILVSDPRLGPVYTSKVDLTDADMRLWAIMEDVPSVALLDTKRTPTCRAPPVPLHRLVPLFLHVHQKSVRLGQCRPGPAQIVPRASPGSGSRSRGGR